MNVVYEFYQSRYGDEEEPIIHKIYNDRSKALDHLDQLVESRFKSYNNCKIEEYSNDKEYSKQITDGETFWHIFAVKFVEYE